MTNLLNTIKLPLRSQKISRASLQGFCPNKKILALRTCITHVWNTNNSANNMHTVAYDNTIGTSTSSILPSYISGYSGSFCLSKKDTRFVVTPYALQTRFMATLPALF